MFHKYVVESESAKFRQKAENKAAKTLQQDDVSEEMRIQHQQRFLSCAAYDIVERKNWTTLDKMRKLHQAKVAAEEARRARMDKHREEVRVAFEKYDEDGSGSIDADELRTLLEMELHESVSKEQLAAAVEEIDTDGDGMIEFEEFLDWYSSDKVAEERRHTS